MHRPPLLFAVLLALAATSAMAGEYQIGLGIGFLGRDGVDLDLGYRPEQSHFQYGLRYLRGKSSTTDPYSPGLVLADKTETWAGPQVVYLFDPEADGTYYVGASLLRYTQKIQDLPVAGRISNSNTVSSTDLYFGGGYIGHLGKSVYYNVGLFISPTFSMTNQTLYGSTEKKGNFDPHVQIGFAF